MLQRIKVGSVANVFLVCTLEGMPKTSLSYVKENWVPESGPRVVRNLSPYIDIHRFLSMILQDRFVLV